MEGQCKTGLQETSMNYTNNEPMYFITLMYMTYNLYKSFLLVLNGNNNAATNPKTMLWFKSMHPCMCVPV